MESTRKFYGKTIIDSRDSDELDLGYQMELHYYKTKNSLVVSEQSKLYGIEVEKRERKGEKIHIEKELMNNITNQEKNIEKVLTILLKNKVTPIGVPDVMQELIQRNIV